MKSTASVLFTALLFSAAPLPARDTSQTQSDSAGNRADSPAYVHVHDSDEAMHQAVHEAQRTLGTFMAALAAPKPGQTGFAVKKRCIEGDQCEHIWLAEVRLNGGVLRGKVDNNPVDTKSLRLGKKVTVRPEEISDWMYVENGRLVGGYTVRAYYRTLSAAKKRQFAQNLGFRLE